MILGLTQPRRSATMLEAQAIGGTKFTSISSKQVDGGIQSDTRSVPFLPSLVSKRSKKQQWHSVATCSNERSGFRETGRRSWSLEEMGVIPTVRLEVKATWEEEDL